MCLLNNDQIIKIAFYILFSIKIYIVYINKNSNLKVRHSGLADLND